MTDRPKLAKSIKPLWFSTVSILLGPFALWYMLAAKLHRRKIGDHYFRSLILLTLAFFGYNGALFFFPVHWSLLLGVHLAACLATAWLVNSGSGSRLFPLGLEPSDKPVSLGEAVLASSMGLFPWVYILALIRNIGELENFSIHLPSDVYTGGLRWMAYSTPLVLAMGWAAWKTRVRPTLRSLLYFYASILVVLAWIMVWEKTDQFLLQIIDVNREPILFGYALENHYRSWVKGFFYGSAFIFGTGYLARAARTHVFLKRALFLGVPSILLYANMLFVLGDWNFYLSGLREHFFEEHQYAFYRAVAKAELSRTPRAYRVPEIIDGLAELEYQEGGIAEAKKLFGYEREACLHHPYYARYLQRSEKALAHLEKPAGSVVKSEIQLEVPVIKPASFLDQDWYALLSAVAFLRADWTDLELRKRLLDLSGSIQLRLPKLGNVPELVAVLRQLDIPAAACFLTEARIRAALGAHKVPFLSLNGRWVPITGYDAGRDGFYYYAYPATSKHDWFRNEDTDLFYHHAGGAFGDASEKARARIYRYSLQKFLPADELSEQIINIGGVGLILGDTSAASPAERRAAFLFEQGDTFYQEHENYPAAAECYRQAAKLFPCDQAFARILYLKRRYFEFASDTRDYQNLFRDDPPKWMANLGPDPKNEKGVVERIMAGKLGTYLMLNWYASPLPDSSAESKSMMDTAVALFTALRNKDPGDPTYADSLATLYYRKGELKKSEEIFTSLMGLYPFGNESVAFRLAWVKLRLGKLSDIPNLLAQCEGFSVEAKYLTMQAAVAIQRGHWRSARSALDRSLKLDKSIGETHALMAEYYRHKGDPIAAQLHLHWQRRSS